MSFHEDMDREEQKKGGKDGNIHIVTQQLSYVYIYIYFIYTEVKL